MFIALAAFFVCLGITAAFNIIVELRAYSAASQEYSDLRRLAPEPAKNTGENPAEQKQEQGREQPSLSEINPDYAGWISIPGTSVDYPVVQGSNNYTYLYYTFTGEENASGTIFIDYRCSGAFDDPFVMLHGHNMLDGSMFADIRHYTRSDFRAEHPEIVITDVDGRTFTYLVYEVRLTDDNDEVYSIPRHLVSDDFEHVLALSTCVRGGGDEERLLVFAGRI